jgi:hypothetical protein
MLDVGLHYPPAWIFELPHSRFENQWGRKWESKDSGKDLPNAVFNNSIRERIASYVAEVFKRTGADYDFVRLGGGKYGEVNYPSHRFDGETNCYWAFDAIAQGRVAGLPDGVASCPVPGWIPGTRTDGHAPARAFVEWYLSSLQNYHDWQLANVRRWYDGDVCYLYGSRGLRPPMLERAIAADLDGGTPDEKAGEIQQGYDWPRMIGGIRDPRAIVYCTWMDGTFRNVYHFNDDTPDLLRWSPVHWQAHLAAANPLKLRVWGENTGRNTREVMRRTFENIKRHKLMGVMWAFESELYENPNPNHYATAADFAEMIKLMSRGA